MKHNRVLNQLKVIAQDVTPVGSARIAAAIVHEKEIVGLGVCNRKSHPLQKKFGKVPEAIYLHAEMDAIKNAIRRKRGTEFLKDSTLYIARMRIIDGEFEEALACPCSGCQGAISKFGIKNVIYTKGKNEPATDEVCS